MKPEPANGLARAAVLPELTEIDAPELKVRDALPVIVVFPKNSKPARVAPDPEETVWVVVPNDAVELLVQADVKGPVEVVDQLDVLKPPDVALGSKYEVLRIVACKAGAPSRESSTGTNARRERAAK